MMMLLGPLIGVVLAMQPPDLSLDTVPCGYFGGNAKRRGDANIEMLAKMRIVMLEKWEGPCWQDCLANGSSAACLPACGVENDIIETHRRIKAVNPKVCSVMYLNTLLDFPFYTLHGVFKAANALTIDSSTKKPMVVRNDNGMEGIYIFGFDTANGHQLYIDTVKNLTSTGIIDGFFGDKFAKGAALTTGTNQWQICNHECGNVTQEQGLAWNAGKVKMIEAVNSFLGDGPWFGNGNTFENQSSNFNGAWQNEATVRHGDPRELIQFVADHLVNHTYVYVSCTDDQKWHINPQNPTSLLSQCDDLVLARFLLAVEKGAILGTNGWDEAYDRPLGDPLGPATYTARVDDAGTAAPAMLHRNFSSGTYVVFTYNDKGTDGIGEIFWNGKPPAPPTPPPPTPPAPTITCGAYHSSQMNDTTFARDDVTHFIKTRSAMACCEACGGDSKCVAWAYHYDTECHLHGRTAESTPEVGTVAGVMKRT
eukprot:m.181039 g.181039  ORF g.181039 m.181039 type:complete len:480 (+) comp32048_c0_seq1:128-1567(+)